MSPQLARLGTRVRSLLRHGPRLAALADALVHAPADGPVLVDADGTLTGAQLADEIRVARPPDSPSLLRIPGHHHRATIIRMLGAALAGWDVMVLHPDDSTLTDPPGAVAGRGRLWLGTSGTTGARQHSARPSYGPGLLLPVGQLWAAWQLGKPGAILVQPALHHGYGLGIALAGLLAQRPLLLPGSKNVVGDMIAAHHPTVTASVPPQLASLPEVPGWRPAVMITGSGPLSAEVQHRAMETFGPVLHNLFGSTEAGFATMATPQDLQRSPGCVGRPLRGVRARLSEGRLEVRSPFATQRRGWVPTGDYAHYDRHGLLVLDGRTDDQTIVNGITINVGAVAEVLRRHPSVETARIVAVPDAVSGHRLEAIVRLRAPVTAEALHQLLRDRATSRVRVRLSFEGPVLPQSPHSPAGGPSPGA